MRAPHVFQLEISAHVFSFCPCICPADIFLDNARRKGSPNLFWRIFQQDGLKIMRRIVPQRIVQMILYLRILSWIYHEEQHQKHRMRNTKLLLKYVKPCVGGISSCGTQVFQSRMNVLKDLQKFWDEGKEVAILEIVQQAAETGIVDVVPRSSASNQDQNAECSLEPRDDDSVPLSYCQRVVSKKISNKERRFYYTCGSKPTQKCNFNQWLDEYVTSEKEKENNGNPSLLHTLAASTTLRTKIKTKGRPKGSDLTIMGLPKVKKKWEVE